MANKTSLSAGIIIGAILDEKIVRTGLATKVFPVVVDQATLPYICYLRTDFVPRSVKDGTGSDTVMIGVECYTAGYSDGVRLAEAVREALDHQSVRYGDLTMRSCTLSKSSESYANDAYVQTLIFNIKI